jgi:hypothetical protein
MADSDSNSLTWKWRLDIDGIILVVHPPAIWRVEYVLYSSNAYIHPVVYILELVAAW